ncbi:MAG: radical SAM protein [Planctomycetales bacterium]|nr:radical SAM protein [Planctomycetales bacterium]
MELKDYSFRGLTQSFCPGCFALVEAKIIERRGRVYFRKRCPDCGVREDFICSDADFYDRYEWSVPGKIPARTFTEPDKGCPFDCGLCTEHEQHTCIALVELTDACNLECPMCFAASLPGAKHRTLDEIRQAIDRLVAAEGRPEILQLSGGEPTIHPDFLSVVDYAYAQPIDYILINTNGLRLASDPELVERLAEKKDRVEIFLQFDGFDDAIHQELRGEALLDRKLRAIERLGQAGLNVTLAATLQGGVNERQIVPIVEFAAARPWITAINFQPATYSGRHVLPETLEQRVTFPDVIKAIAAGIEDYRTDDFIPLPCAHPNCHSISLAYRHNGRLTPLSRWFDFKEHFDLLANGIAFTREKTQQLVRLYTSRLGCGASCGCGEPQKDGDTTQTHSETDAREPDGGEELMRRLLAGSLGARDFLRITITSFLDVYNFDLRRVMKCCTHHVLPSGHVIPFCAYNVLYRDGRVTLPPLRERNARTGEPLESGPPKTGSETL